MNAGSTFPPLARNTALTTAASIEGKASFKVLSACCSGANGRGGFGGATSSPDPVCEVVDALVDFGGDAGVSRGSSSKSNALAVVGDSGRSSNLCAMISHAASPTFVFAWVTGFSVSDMSTLLNNTANCVLFKFG